MRRRIIKQGHSTHTITLPAKWIKKYNFKAGDEVEMEEQGRNLIISSDKGYASSKAKINVDSLPQSLLYRTIIALYKKGHDEIELRFENPVTKDRSNKDINVLDCIHKTVDQLIGVEIIKNTEKSCLIKQLSAIEEAEFDNVIRRIFLLIKSMSSDVLCNLGKHNFDALSQAEFQHNTIERFVNFCLRLLNKRGHVDFDKTSLYYYLIFQLEEITDVYKFIASDARKNAPKFSKDALKIFESTNESFNHFYDLFYNYNNKKVTKLINLRREIWKKIKELEKKGNLEDIKLVSRLAVIVVILLNLAETKLSLSL